jgi:hypothetical protein
MQWSKGKCRRQWIKSMKCIVASVLWSVVVVTLCRVTDKVCFHDISLILVRVEGAHGGEGGAPEHHTWHTWCPHLTNRISSPIRPKIIHAALEARVFRGLIYIGTMIQCVDRHFLEMTKVARLSQICVGVDVCAASTWTNILGVVLI